MGPDNLQESYFAFVFVAVQGSESLDDLGVLPCGFCLLLS